MHRDFYPELSPGNFYHIFNRANGNEKLFFQERNYDYFLQRYSYYLSEYLETYAYSLLQNHFHLLVRILEKEKLSKFLKLGKFKGGDFSALLSEQFRLFFMSYSKSINQQEQRTGSLFKKNFKRKLIDNPHYFKHVIYYIHHQPSHHGYEIEDLDYHHSSYLSFLTEKNTKLMREDVLKWFGSKDHFQEFHHSKQKLNDIEPFIIEED